MNQPLNAIVGPTGVGKSSFAVQLANACNAELISADSRQVYIGMDIGTGKETDQGTWSTVNNRRTLIINDVPIHGLDLVYPNQNFSISDWYRLAIQLITEIKDRGNQPIIVGGTGFYLDALQGKVQTLSIKPDPVLRQSLAQLSPSDLLEKLNQLDSARAGQLNNSDRHNPARLIRAIEVAISSEQPSRHVATLSSCPLNLLGLTMPKTQLLQRVDARIDQMIEQGLVKEVQNLISQYGSNSQAMTGIGYQEIVNYLNHTLTLPQAIYHIKIHTHQYIKRQYTWLNKQPVTWVDVTQPNWQDRAQ